MLVGTVRRLSAKGTRKLVEHYADQLVWVRYRYDTAQGVGTAIDQVLEALSDIEKYGGKR